MHPTTALARATIQACLEAGAREFCVCAGSRNSPLIRQLAAQPGVKLWHFFEERDAAFFALGRSRALRQPVAVLTTSGTAAAELFPAVIEAHYQGMPLLCITADRPQSYRYSGAPQAINQERLFADYARPFADITAPEQFADLVWDQQGPAHWNICLEEPQAGCHYLPLAVSASSMETTPPANAVTLTETPDLILLGEMLPSEQQAAQRLLSQMPATPVWAEAASGLRGWLQGTPHRQLLQGDAVLRTFSGRHILRLGGVPSCRLWRDLETRTEIVVHSITRTCHPGLARPSGQRLFVPELRPAGPALPQSWEFPARPLAGAVAAAFPQSEPYLLGKLAEMIPSTAGIFLGNSLTIRTWNLVVPPHPAEPNLHVMRGANGIDGNLSFALAALADFAEAWILVGDLTALYNLAAPWVLAQMRRQRLRIVVMNNGGGRLFRRLPSLQDTNPQEQDLIENPHAIRLQGWATLWGLPYQQIAQLSGAALPLPDGPIVLEIVPEEEHTEAFWVAYGAVSSSQGMNSTP